MCTKIFNFWDYAHQWIRSNKIKSPLWNKNNTFSNGVNEQNTHTYKQKDKIRKNQCENKL